MAVHCCAWRPERASQRQPTCRRAVGALSATHVPVTPLPPADVSPTELSLEQRQQAAQRARALQEALEIEDTSQLLVTAEGLDQRLARVMPYLPGDRAGKNNNCAYSGRPAGPGAKCPAFYRQRSMRWPVHGIGGGGEALPAGLCGAAIRDPAASRIAVTPCKMLHCPASPVVDEHQ